MAANGKRIDAFNLQPGRMIGGKYRVESMLGAGWEGEVYKVVESRTGISRAAKLFFPHRNENDKAVLFYAKKLDALARCPIVIHYIHSESLRLKQQPITCLISEYVEGQLFGRFVKDQKNGHLRPFEALHVVYALACGLEQIHKAGEYHGDIHEDNVLIQRQGIFFDIKLVDFFHWGASSAARRRDDVADVIRLLYDSLGGQKRYKLQPKYIKDICRGLRRDLIARKYPNATKLREHLESFVWNM